MATRTSKNVKVNPAGALGNTANSIPARILKDVNSKLEKTPPIQGMPGVGGTFIKPDGAKFVARAKQVKTAKEQRMADYRKELSRLAAIGNKRLKRLEDNKLTDSPAYRGLFDHGGNHKFSVKGKNWNQVQQEMARLKGFLNAKTSTVRGLYSHLKDLADVAKIKYKKVSDIKAAVGSFFKLTTEIHKALKSMDDQAYSLGSTRLFEAVNTYVQVQGIDLTNLEQDTAVMAEAMAQYISELYKPKLIPADQLRVIEASQWYTPK